MFLKNWNFSLFRLLFCPYSSGNWSFDYNVFCDLLRLPFRPQHHSLSTDHIVSYCEFEARLCLLLLVLLPALHLNDFANVKTRWAASAFEILHFHLPFFHVFSFINSFEFSNTQYYRIEATYFCSAGIPNVDVKVVWCLNERPIVDGVEGVHKVFTLFMRAPFNSSTLNTHDKVMKIML